MPLKKNGDDDRKKTFDAGSDAYSLPKKMMKAPEKRKVIDSKVEVAHHAAGASDTYRGLLSCRASKLYH